MTQLARVDNWAGSASVNLPMPSAYLFDIGNVILRFDFRKTLSRLAPDLTLSPEEALQQVGDLNLRFEKGLLEIDEFIEEASRKTGYRGTKDEFRAAYEDIFDLNKSIESFASAKMKEGTPCFLLSNTNAIHVPYFTSRYPVFSGFQGAIYSHEVGCMKPDQEIYEAAINQLGLTPRETIYIDDIAANCGAGREAGFLAIQYHADRHEDFLEELAQIERSEADR